MSTLAKRGASACSAGRIGSYCDSVMLAWYICKYFGLVLSLEIVVRSRKMVKIVLMKSGGQGGLFRSGRPVLNMFTALFDDDSISS